MTQLDPNPITAPDYEEIAADYDRRYRQGESAGIRETITAWKRAAAPGAWLEVGCGTGQWLLENPSTLQAFGVDGSRQMLVNAAKKGSEGILVQGWAERLPFADDSFTAVAVIHAFHHFPQPDQFLRQVVRVLDQAGGLLVLGMNAHAEEIDWYLYDFFDGTRHRDQARFPDFRQLSKRLVELGFDRVDRGLAESIDDTYVGEEVLGQPFLQRRGCSQLALLSDEEYQRGIDRIQRTIVAEPDHVFRALIPLEYLWAVKASGPNPMGEA